MSRWKWSTAMLAGLLLVGATLAALLLTTPPFPLAAAEQLFQSLVLSLAAPKQPPHPRLAIIGITEDTLARFPYRSPVDRGFLAGLIDRLAADGVSAIGLDVLLDRPTEPAKDAALRQAIHRQVPPVVTISLAPETPLEPEQAKVLHGFLDGARTGTANFTRDLFDDMLRRHVPVHPASGARSFTAALAEAAGVAAPSRPFIIEWRPRAAGPVAPVYPAEAVALLPPDWLRGRIALIGTLIPGMDEHRTPASAFGRPSFGIEVHAQILAQMLDGRAGMAGRNWPAVLATGAMAAAGLLAGAMLRGRALILVLAGLLLAWPGGVLAAVVHGLPPGPGLAPMLACLAAAGGARAWRGRDERRDRAVLHSLFARFVSAPVAEAMLRERDLFLAGGRPKPQELTATVLFADVAGFTRICESLPPEPLIAWNDRYIDTMVSLIMAEGGVVLRFIGDGILAVFGAPVPRREAAEIAADARAAARSALAMEQAMRELNAGWRAEGLPEGGLRIGLHTGPMVAGGIGQGARMEFCLLGDTANVGARLEQLGKQHGGEGPGCCTIMVGEPTWLLLGDEFSGLRVGELELRNRRARMAAWRIDSAAAEAAARPRSPEMQAPTA